MCTAPACPPAPPTPPRSFRSIPRRAVFSAPDSPPPPLSSRSNSPAHTPRRFPPPPASLLRRCPPTASATCQRLRRAQPPSPRPRASRPSQNPQSQFSPGLPEPPRTRSPPARRLPLPELLPPDSEFHLPWLLSSRMLLFCPLAEKSLLLFRSASVSAIRPTPRRPASDSPGSTYIPAAPRFSASRAATRDAPGTPPSATRHKPSTAQFPAFPTSPALSPAPTAEIPPDTCPLPRSAAR